MRKQNNYALLGTTSLLCLVILCLAWLGRNPWLAAGGALGLCYVMLRLTYANKGSP